MVMLVWFILSLCGVCEFTWLPVAIDLGAFVIITCFFNSEGSIDVYQNAFIGGCIFATCKYFLSLSISGWWILATPVWFIIAFYVPGGFTITNLLLDKFYLMDLPTWALVVGIIGDVLSLLTVILTVVENVKGTR